MTTKLVSHPTAGYQFLPGIPPYSAGVVAQPGFEIEQIVLSEPMPWQAGLRAVRTCLRNLGLSEKHLCGVELRCPQPHSMEDFISFNADYCGLLEDWSILVDGLNPIARTNVAPVTNPPGQTMLSAFSFTKPAAESRLTFVVAGAGELPHRDLDATHIVRRGEASEDALKDKAACVVSILLHRLRQLLVPHEALTDINIYSAHSIAGIIDNVLIDAFPKAARLPLSWYWSRPPVEDIEFEMDVRGVARRSTVTM